MERQAVRQLAFNLEQFLHENAHLIDQVAPHKHIAIELRNGVHYSQLHIECDGKPFAASDDPYITVRINR